MAFKIPRRVGVALAAAAGMSLVLAACNTGTSSSSNAPTNATAGNATASGTSGTGGGGAAGGGQAVDPFLLAPSDASTFNADQTCPTVKAPITGGNMTTVYCKVLPLPDGPIGDPNKTYTFCMSQALTGSTWAVAQQESVMVEAQRHPNVKVSYYNTNNDPLKQVADLDTCLAKKVDGILVWPHSVAPLTPEIQKIKNSGTVVIGMERTVATRDYTGWVYLDNAAATADVASAVCDKLGSKGTVAETDGSVGSSPQILRREGFVTALNKKCPNVKVVFTAPTDYTRGQGYKVATDFLQSGQGQHIDAWYTQYTEIGFGVAQALKDAHRTNIPQYSIVDGKAAVQAVADGTFAAIAPWNPVHGDVALRAAIYNIEHKSVPKDLLLVQPPLITQANAQQQLQLTWPG
ncbi:MAG: substrate-binding domain-containing protein [Mycobacteriaceae bacterium]|nr:substrate-binding domain-containing protein [Mycobacteriaceae bacterium]